MRNCKSPSAIYLVYSTEMESTGQAVTRALIKLLRFLYTKIRIRQPNTLIDCKKWQLWQLNRLSDRTY